MVSANDTVQYVFLCFETLALSIFIYFVNKYTRKFRDSRDPYTIACFVFIIFTVTSKVVLRTAYLVSDKDCTDCKMRLDILNCCNQTAYYLPTGFFTIAVIINVTRWLLLIDSYNKMQYHLDTMKDSDHFAQSIHDNNKAIKFYYITLLCLAIFAFIVTLVKIVNQCNLGIDEGKMIENAIFLTMLFVLNIGSIIIYIYSQRYFSLYYSKQINLNQDIIQDDQIQEMKKSVRFLTFFMYTICIIILIRLIVMVVYELSYSYDLFEFKGDAAISLTVLIYMTEITLTLMMSQSIKQTTTTQKRTQTIQIDNQPILPHDDKADISDMDMSQGELMQEIEQNILRMEAFQVIEDVHNNKQSQKIIGGSNNLTPYDSPKKKITQQFNNINSFGVDVSDNNSSQNHPTM